MFVHKLVVQFILTKNILPYHNLTNHLLQGALPNLTKPYLA